ncbi:MAG TPA: choice-of-anchor Q domain-containing protein, partial [Bacteroidales bacterium]|nr:choice-of-anchor Q domain-containing protein [Bacteroidales bacterium]
MRAFRCLVLIIAFFLAQKGFPQQTLWVTHWADSGPGSLREVISSASAGDIIRFVPNISSITLSSAEIHINKPIKIIGNEDIITIKRNLSESTPHFRIFNISYTDYPLDTLILKNLNFKYGFSSDGDDENQDGKDGGAIIASNPNNIIKIINCQFTNNQCGNGITNLHVTTKSKKRADSGRGGHGGAIYSDAMLIIENCSFSLNETGSGGAIYLNNINWFIEAGIGGHGGAIACNSYLIINDCLFNNNHTKSGGLAKSSSRYTSMALGGSAGYGGAIYCSSGVEIINTTFTGNSTGTGGTGIGDGWVMGVGGDGGHGGALFAIDSTACVTNCTFSENKAGDGGLEGGDGAAHGGSGGYGGCIYTKNAWIIIDNCSFLNNTAGAGTSGSAYHAGLGGDGGSGGAICAIDSQIEILESVFTDHCAGNGGYGGSAVWSIAGKGGHAGAVYVENSYGAIKSTIFQRNHTGKAGDSYVQHEKIDTNISINGGSGGAVFLSGQSSLLIMKSEFSANNTLDGGSIIGPGDSLTPGGDGGNGGAIALSQNSLLRMVNSLVYGNSTGIAGVNITDSTMTGSNGTGGGISLNENSNLMLINSIIAGNLTGVTEKPGSFIPALGLGGGIYCEDTSISIFNSIIAFNKVNKLNSICDNELFTNSHLDHCMIYDTSGFSYTGTGNIFHKDPQFLNFPDNLNVLPSSPAINNGNPDTTGLSLPEYDLIGNQRIYDRIDIGAFEYPYELSDSLCIISDAIDFNDVIIGLSVIDSLKLVNVGDATILIDSLLMPDDFSILADDAIWSNRLDSIILYSGDEEQYFVRFMPEYPGRYMDSASIFINLHPDPHILKVMGEGIQPLEIDISSNCSDSVFAGQLYSCRIEIESHNGFPVDVQIFEKPNWCNLNNQSDTLLEISGAPVYSDIGQHELHIRVGDGLIFNEFYQEIDVIEPIIPYVEYNCPLSINVEQIFNCLISALGNNHLPVNIEIINYPNWIDWNQKSDDTIEVYGTPGINDIGSALFEFSAFDSLAEHTISFTVVIGPTGTLSPDDIIYFQRFIISPNPSKDLFYLAFHDDNLPNELEIGIYSCTGTRIDHLFINETCNTVPINLQNLPAGIYFVRLTIDGKETVT